MLTLTPVNGKKSSSITDRYKLHSLIPVRTIFNQLSESAVRSYSFSRIELIDSTFSSILYAGSSTSGYLTLSDLFANLKRLIKAEAGKRWFVTVYYDKIDTLFHHYGIENDSAKIELRRFFSMLSELAEELHSKEKEKCTLLITGDHGQVPFYPDRLMNIYTDQYLNFMKLPPTGDPRALFMHTTREYENILFEKLKRDSPFSFITKNKDEVISLLGPGPFHRELYSRIGDYMLLPERGGSYMLSFNGVRHEAMKAGHGGLHSEEMQVPLIYSTLDQYSVSMR